MQLKQQIDSCVRITVQIPKDAAQRLRQMAVEGNPALRALGIMSVQLDGDSVISIKIPGQEINIKTTDNESDVSARTSGALGDFTNLLETVGSAMDPVTSGPFLHSQSQYSISTKNIGISNSNLASPSQLQLHQYVQDRRNMLLGGPSTSSAAQAILQKQYQQSSQGQFVQGQTLFKPPNTVCPMDGKVPVPPISSNSNNGPNVRDYPFVSMRQAKVLQGRENVLNNSLLNSNKESPHSSPHALQTAQNGQKDISTAFSLSPNASLKVINNSSDVEPLSNASVLSANKSKFLQPPPPPYPGIANTASTAINKPASQMNKIVQNYMHKEVSGPPVGALQPTTSTPTNINNIAISSPLLVNLLQNDGNSIANPVKTKTLNQQQTSPLNPVSQQQLSSSMRTQNIASDILMDNKHSQQHTQSPTQLLHSVSEHASTSMALSTSSANMRNIHQQHALTSPGSNLYGHHHLQSNFEPNVTSQQGNFRMQQHQQQLQSSIVSVVGTPPQRFTQQQLQQQQLIQQSHIMQTQLSQQVAVGGIMLSNVHKQQHAHVRQVRPCGIQGQIGPQQHHQQQQSHQLLSSGGKSPAASHSPASSHHSLHSPLMGPHQQQLLSPSITPVQSPHALSSHSQKHLVQQLQPHAQLQQQLQPTQTSNVIPSTASPSSQGVNNIHNKKISLAPQSSVTGSNTDGSETETHVLAPLPNYDQSSNTSLAMRWPTLNKPMDSVTKSSFQEFARYQMQYNLQQQQINNIQQSRPEKLDLHRQQLNDHVISPQSDTIEAMVGVSSLDGISTVTGLSDPLITLSDFEALTTNDLDALLPTLNCDLDSTLTLDDKNELESLLQDAKDLDLDLIEENLSAVGVDFDDTAVAASSLLNVESTQVPPNVTLTPTQFGEQKTQLSQNIQQQSAFSVSNIIPNQNNKLVQHDGIEQPKGIIQNRYKEEDNLFTGNDLLFPSVQTVQQHSNHHLQKHAYLLQNQGSSVGNANKIHFKGTASVAPSNNQKQFLINPLTGDMEPIESGDSETDAEQESHQPISTSPKAREVLPLAESCNTNLPRTVFLDDDSNSSCNGFSKASTNERNNTTTPGPASDTERSRDSLISNKSNRSAKNPKPDCIQVPNKSFTLVKNIDDMVSSKSPSPNLLAITKESASITAVMTKTGASQKKSKCNLLREKQNNVRDKRQEGHSNPGSSKSKRTKGNGKGKVVAATLCTSSLPTAESGPTTSSLKTHPTDLGVNNEKIKLRLKLEKKEPVSPAYKVDISFVAVPKLTTSESTSGNLNIMDQGVYSSSTHLKANINHNATASLSTLNKQQNHIEPSKLVQQKPITFSNFVPPQTVNIGTSSGYDEPRVPPLHISLRGGKNSIVIKSRSKDRKKTLNILGTAASSGDGEDGSKPITNKQLKMQPLQVSHANTEIITPEKILQFSSSGSTSSTSTDLTGISGSCNNSGTVLVSTRLKPLPNTCSEPISVTASITTNPISTETSFLGSKNGLTISAIKSMDSNSGTGSNNNKSIIIGSTNVGTLPTQILTQSQYQTNKGPSTISQHQMQPSKIPTSLHSSITLNSIPNNNIVTCASDSSVNITNRIINTLNEKAATIVTSVGNGGGKPLSKNLKPPSYLTAVQHLQLKRQQQQRQTHPSENPSTQQKIASVTMLPTSTTLKRVALPNTSTGNVDLTPNAEKLNTSSEINVSIKSKTPPVSNPSSVHEKTSEKMTTEPVSTISAPVKNCCININTVVVSTSQETIVSNTPTASSNVILRTSPPSNGNGTSGHGNGNGAGEDSGIDSMDALSEKSPHQQSSSSPTQQQISSGSGCINIEKPTSALVVNKSLACELSRENQNIVDTNIKGSSRSHVIKNDVVADQNKSKVIDYADDEIEKALAKMEGYSENCLDRTSKALTTVETDLKEDSSIIKKTTIEEKLPYAEAISGGKLDNFVKTITGSDEANKLQEAQLSESGRIKVEAIFIENENKNKSNLETENRLEGANNVESTISSRNLDTTQDIEHGCFESKKKDKNPPDNKNKIESETHKHESSQPHGQDVAFPPISIEIPVHSESEINRIRTRASIRLGSPLDINKSSPTTLIASLNPPLERPPSAHDSVNTNQKINIGGNANGTQTGHFTGTKRKHHESDTDVNSCDNDCSGGKRLRSTDNVKDTEKASESQTTTMCNVVRKNEESSDSDEPLIEVAEKVRNSKVVNANVNCSEPVVQATFVKSPSAKNEFCQISSLEKNTRNNRTIGQQHNSSNIGSPTGNVTITSNPPVPSSTMPMLKILTTGPIKPSCGNSNSIVSVDSNINNTSSTPAHSTRGNSNAVPVLQGCTGINSNNNTIGDEKVGTRRSVRANAGVHKNVYGRSSNSTATTSPTAGQNVDTVKSTVMTKSVGLHGSEHIGVVEARRKTRSAGEAQLTEGRRRRSSRDYK